jgi:NAD(P)-dependent dehydrogenase (short-subunit alcohol dehydrogenase family)
MGNTKSVAIITGASQGIGRAAAHRLARDFSAIVLAARNADALGEVANTVKTAGRRTSCLRPRFEQSRICRNTREDYARSFRQDQRPAQYCGRGATS